LQILAHYEYNLIIILPDTKMLKFIPRIKFNLTNEHKISLLKAFDAHELVTGRAIKLFEDSLRKKMKKKYCITSSNGFSSLLLAIHATKLKNKRILTSALSTCFAIPNAILASGNIPVYCDVDPDSGNIDVKEAEKIFKIKPFDAIVSPNYFGILSDIQQLKKFKVPVIEDCAQSFMSNMQVVSVADMQVFSFYPTKVVNAIDGGAILTNDVNQYKIIKSKVYYGDQFVNDNVVRYNHRMINIHAAIGLVSLSRIKKVIKRHHQIAEAYKQVIQSHKKVSYLGSENSRNILYKFLLKFQSANECQDFIRTMKKADVHCDREFVILTKKKKFVSATRLLNTTCSVPLYETLTEKEIKYICLLLNRLN